MTTRDGTTASIPLRVWLAPQALNALPQGLVEQLDRGSAVVRSDPLGCSEDLEGPAVLVFTPADAESPNRDRLLALAKRALPGRPVLFGGTRTKDVLLDAINNWGVGRVVPKDFPAELIVDAVDKIHEAATAELAVQRAASELAEETERLDRAVTELGSTRDRFLHAERLATVGRFTAGLTEYMRRQQSTLDRFEEAAKTLADDEELQTMLDNSSEGIRSISVLLDEISAYAEDRQQTYSMRAEPVDAIVQHVVDFTRFDPLRRGRNLHTRLASDGTARVDRHRIYQVLINLLRNALEATDAGGRVELRTARDDDMVVIEVEDTGCGMPDEVRRKIFEPFFTTKGEKGVGLGLGISRMAIERHGGQLECTSEPGQGTCFSIRLPAAS